MANPIFDKRVNLLPDFYPGDAFPPADDCTLTVSSIYGMTQTSVPGKHTYLHQECLNLARLILI